VVIRPLTKNQLVKAQQANRQEKREKQWQMQS
jgi:hypothetical protein